MRTMQTKASRRQSAQPEQRAVQAQPALAGHKPNPLGNAGLLMSLQRSHGNRYVQRLLKAKGNAAREVIQAKLNISQPGDPYEQEAERVAQEVMSMSHAATAHGGAKAVNVQRMCAECEEQSLHKASQGPAASEPAGLEERVDRARSGGEPLPDSARSFFEPRFGRDFSQVRIHTDGAAGESAQELNARAYTVGRDIVFGTGEYAPETDSGKALLAHELVHVVQQRGQHVQRLTVTGIGAGTQSTCGGYTRQWDFTLDAAAPEAGYIVQKVDFYKDTAACDKPAVTATPATPTLTFWEAWPVNSGAKLFDLRATIGYTDQSSAVNHPDTTGTVAATGTIKFFKSSVTGNLGSLTADGLWHRGVSGGERQSGVLPSTHTEPVWWSGTPEEGPATRSAQSAWSCCGEASTQFNTITFNP
jgi:hypothetical protein